MSIVFNFLVAQDQAARLFGAPHFVTDALP